MRKNALSICCFTCAAGAIGAFCRWLQNQLAFDETGLSAASAWNYIVPLVLIAAAVCFYCIVARYKRSGLEMTTDFYGTFDGSTRLFVPLAWVIGAAMLNRISGLFFDLMVTASIAAISLEAFKHREFLLPLALICVAGALVTYWYDLKVCRFLFPDYSDESFLTMNTAAR